MQLEYSNLNFHTVSLCSQPPGDLTATRRRPAYSAASPRRTTDICKFSKIRCVDYSYQKESSRILGISRAQSTIVMAKKILISGTTHIPGRQTIREGFLYRGTKLIKLLPKEIRNENVMSKFKKES